LCGHYHQNPQIGLDCTYTCGDSKAMEQSFKAEQWPSICLHYEQGIISILHNWEVLNISIRNWQLKEALLVSFIDYALKKVCCQNK
jgi:hypothetical protein